MDDVFVSSSAFSFAMDVRASRASRETVEGVVVPIPRARSRDDRSRLTDARARENLARWLLFGAQFCDRLRNALRARIAPDTRFTHAHIDEHALHDRSRDAAPSGETIRARDRDARIAR